MLFYSFFQPHYSPRAIRALDQIDRLPKFVQTHDAAKTHSFTYNDLQSVIQQSHAPAVKLDVQHTKDHHFVVFSQKALNGTTDSEGKISEKTLKDLACVYYKDGDEEHKQPLLLLDDALKNMNGRMTVFLNVLTQDYFNAESAQALVNVIQKHRAHAFVVVESLNPFFLLRLRDLDSTIKLQYDLITANHKQYLGQLYEFTDIPWTYQWHWLQKQIMRLLRPDILGVHYTLEEDYVLDLLEKKFVLYVWGTQDQSIIARYLESGATGYQGTEQYVTNERPRQAMYPDTIESLVELVKGYAEKQHVWRVNYLKNYYHRQNDDSIYTVELSRLKHLYYQPETQKLVAEAGVTFKEIQQYLTQFARALPVYPFDHALSVHQGVSENRFGFGYQRQTLAHIVSRIKLLQPNGELIICDENTHTEYFHAALGGMGLFGAIVEVEFNTVDNLLLARQRLGEDVDNAAVYWLAAPSVETDLDSIEKFAYQIAQPIALAFKPIKIRRSRVWTANRSAMYGQGFSVLNPIFYHLTNAFEPKKVSLNEAGYVLQSPHTPVYADTQIYVSRYYLPIEAIPHLIDKLNEHRSTDKAISIIRIHGVHLQADEISAIRFAPSGGIGVEIYWLIISSEQNDFEKMQLLLTDFVLSQQGNFHLANHFYTNQQLKQGYPGLANLLTQVSPTLHTDLVNHQAMQR